MLIRKICVLLAISKCWVTVMPFYIAVPKTSPRSNNLLIYQSQDPSSESDKDIESTSLTRREVAILAIGGLAYGKVVSVAISKIKRGDAILLNMNHAWQMFSNELLSKQLLLR
eukprot:818404_1